MKRFISILLCLSMAFMCACGSSVSKEENETSTETTINNGNPDEQITGADWRTWKPYGYAERKMRGETSGVYFESFYDSAVVKILEDSSSYTVLQEITLAHSPIANQSYLENNICFEDLNDDGYDDLIITDLVDEKPLVETYLWNEAEGAYKYEEPSEAVPDDEARVYTAYDAFSEVVEEVSKNCPDNSYMLYNADGDNYPELFIEQDEEKAIYVYKVTDNGGYGCELLGVIPGSEQGALACDEMGKLLMNRFVQGARYVDTVEIIDDQIVLTEIYAAEEEEYGFTGMGEIMTPVSDLNRFYIWEF